MKWSAEKEREALQRRGAGETYRSIGESLGFSATSVKHKVRRLQQAANNDKYKHTAEKRALAVQYLSGTGLRILETHAGFGGMTGLYSRYGTVESYDIAQPRVEAVNALAQNGVTAIKADSEREIIRLLASGCVFDVVDIDPYGMPSRYFPHVFGLINDGLLFITLPMIGVAQMNKITIRHLEAFWGVDYKDKDSYISTVIKKLEDCAFMHKRAIEVLQVERIDRVFRLALKVEKRSLCDIVGLVVNR